MKISNLATVFFIKKNQLIYPYLSHYTGPSQVGGRGPRFSFFYPILFLPFFSLVSFFITPLGFVGNHVLHFRFTNNLTQNSLLEKFIKPPAKKRTGRTYNPYNEYGLERVSGHLVRKTSSPFFVSFLGKRKVVLPSYYFFNKIPHLLKNCKDFLEIYY